MSNPATSPVGAFAFVPASCFQRRFPFKGTGNRNFVRVGRPAFAIGPVSWKHDQPETQVVVPVGRVVVVANHRTPVASGVVPRAGERPGPTVRASGRNPVASNGASAKFQAVARAGELGQRPHSSAEFYIVELAVLPFHLVFFQFVKQPLSTLRGLPDSLPKDPESQERDASVATVQLYVGLQTQSRVFFQEKSTFALVLSRKGPKLDRPSSAVFHGGAGLMRSDSGGASDTVPPWKAALPGLSGFASPWNKTNRTGRKFY